MQTVTHSLTLDLLRPGNQCSVYIRQGDAGTHLLNIALRQGAGVFDVPDDALALIRLKHTQTGQVQELPCSSIADGRVLFVVPDEATQTSGQVECDICILHDGYRLHSPSFYLNITSTMVMAVG